ncbi:unnamed protein product [Prorocentrum cordatum]|uniref:Uncharacterized protein n=1 Tax=Prorocentrum cordatum TaxID=2364126 RepID=A0ABN9U7H2_9DINO|nr:unnamed protein product [Polarella glacialis]
MCHRACPLESFPRLGAAHLLPAGKHAPQTSRRLGHAGMAFTFWCAQAPSSPEKDTTGAVVGNFCSVCRCGALGGTPCPLRAEMARRSASRGGRAWTPGGGQRGWGPPGWVV